MTKLSDKNKAMVALSILACSALAGWVSFNSGFDYGQDSALCISLAISGVDTVGDNDFCKRASPKNTPIKRAARMTWVNLCDAPTPNQDTQHD